MAQSEPLYHRFRNALMQTAIRVAPRSLARFNNARLGFPRCVYTGAGGIGDDLLCSTIFRELKKRGEPHIVMRSRYRSLFENNPDVDIVLRERVPVVAPLMVQGLNFLLLTYPSPGRPMVEHIIKVMCRLAGITGRVALRPYIFLRPSEVAAGRRFDRQLVIQSSGLSANIPMKNKEWYPERYQEVANRLQRKASLIQLGSRTDPPLKGVLDLRDKTSLRQAAAILANSMIFIGQVGFLMHLARAVDCRSVIIYGGRETPDKTGYIANKNLVGVTPCSPCWEANKCDYDRDCMKMISVEAVVNAALEQIECYRSPLEIEVVNL